VQHRATEQKGLGLVAPLPVTGHIGGALGREDRPHPHPHPGEIYRFRSFRLMFSENKLLLSCPTAAFAVALQRCNLLLQRFPDSKKGRFDFVYEKAQLQSLSFQSL
jgi:hypothetical protein